MLSNSGLSTKRGPVQLSSVPAARPLTKKLVLLSKCSQGVEVAQPLQRIVHTGSARLSTESRV